MSDLVVHVMNVHIPPMSTLGFAMGYDDAGRRVEFAGDHRPMRLMGLALENGEDVTVRVPVHAITSIETQKTEKERPS